MTEAREFIASATASQRQRFVVAEAEDVDAAMASGAWIATSEAVEVKR